MRFFPQSVFADAVLFPHDQSMTSNPDLHCQSTFAERMIAAALGLGMGLWTLSLSGCSPQTGSEARSTGEPAARSVQDSNKLPAGAAAADIPTASDGANRPSALDSALAAQSGSEEQESTHPWAKPPVEPAEPHEELLPLLEDDWVRLHPGYEVWLDAKNHQVIVGGRVCFREGPLEMFACPMRTKEHESVISTISDAEIVHTGLLAAGAIPGKPVQWDPEHVPATGPTVQITVVWSDEGMRDEIDARQMILDVVKQQPLEHNWVFCGSGVWQDANDPEWREYFADSGDMICVTNFSTAMMDLQVESSNMQEGLRYYANTEKIPPLGKPVLLILKPDLSTNPENAEAPQRGE
jgi:hypothetical protein